MIVAWLVIATTSAFAAGALVTSGAWRIHRALTAFALLGATSNATWVLWPRLATPERWGAAETITAWCACLAGLEMTRRAFSFRVSAWRATAREAIAAFAVAAIVGALALDQPGDDRWGYRGVAFASAATSALLSALIAGALRRRAPRETLPAVAMPALAVLYAMQTIYLATFEVSRAWAHRLGWATTCAYVLTLLAIAVAAGPLERDPEPVEVAA